MANQEMLLDLNSDIKKQKNRKKFKKDKTKIDKQKKYIKKIESENRKSNNRVKELKKDQIAITKQIQRGKIKLKYGKNQISKIQKKIDVYEKMKLPVASEKNYLNMIQGKDFYYIVDNGFTIKKIKHSKLIKMNNPAETFTKEMISDINKSVKSLEKALKNKNLSKKTKNALNKKLFVLNKLKSKAELNLRYVRTKNEDVFEEEIEDDESGGPMLYLQVGETIRINS